MAWTPPFPLDSIVLLGGEERNSTAYTAEIVPGSRSRPNRVLLYDACQYSCCFCQGGDKFALAHTGEGACGIPDGDTIVMTGGWFSSFVTRFGR